MFRGAAVYPSTTQQPLIRFASSPVLAMARKSLKGAIGTGKCLSYVS